MVREIVFDTETTGLNPYSGDKIIEFSLLKYKEGKQISLFYFLSIIFLSIFAP